VYVHNPLLFNFGLEYAIRITQENQLKLKLNGTYQFMVYADDVNLFGDNINTINKNIEVLIDASKDVSLEVNTEKTKCMLMSRHQNAEKIHYINIGNTCNLRKYGKVKIFVNESNKSIFD
jgi:hypothetical protein